MGQYPGFAVGGFTAIFAITLYEIIRDRVEHEAKKRAIREAYEKLHRLEGSKN